MVFRVGFKRSLLVCVIFFVLLLFFFVYSVKKWWFFFVEFRFTSVNLTNCSVFIQNSHLYWSKCSSSSSLNAPRKPRNISQPKMKVKNAMVTESTTISLQFDFIIHRTSFCLFFFFVWFTLIPFCPIHTKTNLLRKCCIIAVEWMALNWTYENYCVVCTIWLHVFWAFPVFQPFT